MPSSAEDAYVRFLDLPPGPRPPHHYALLELEIFCSQPERIENAVQKLFRRIKPYEDAPDRKTREAIQDIMNQIATARVVLMDGQSKDAYDRELAERLGLDREAIIESRLATPRPEHELVVSAGPALVGHRLPLPTDAIVTIGSDPHCTLTLESARMSPLHARLRWIDDGWCLEQVDRRRVCFVNGQRVSRHRPVSGDAVDLGGYRLRFYGIPDEGGMGRGGPPPLSLTLQAGPSIPDPHFHALPTETLLVGNDDTVLWQLPHPMVSRHHCRIEPAQGIWTVSDLHSTNGTRVNDDEAGAEYPLRHRDRLSIGPFEIQVSLRR
jgi:pSer/pThr/pTyr-binding forkhead associated (FHA) protein